MVSLLLGRQEVFWNFEDVALFFSSLSVLDVLLSGAIHLGLLARDSVNHPAPIMTFSTLVFLTISLLGILRMRYHRGILQALGWTLPQRRYCWICSTGGFLLGVRRGIAIHGAKTGNSGISLLAAVLLSTTLGPFLEESLFRGCLLPLIACRVDRITAILSTGFLFATMHQPQTVEQCAWLFLNGIAYGCVRVFSGATSASAIMHSATNLTLWALFKF